PRMTRATTGRANPWARTVSALPAARTSIATASTVRRSSGPRIRGTTGAVTAATRPVMVRLNPAVPEETPRPSAIGVSTPTGSISEVTTRKVLNESTAIATHCRRVVRAVSVSAAGGEAGEVMAASQLRAAGANNSDLLTDR